MLEHENGSVTTRTITTACPASPVAQSFGEREKPDFRDEAALLIEAARRGEPAAWDLLVRRFRPLVRGIARSYRLDDSEMDDVVQMVWLRLIEHIERIREPRALSKWIITTARHESLRLARGHAKLVSIDLVLVDAEPAAEHVDVAGTLLRSEVARIIREGLAELPPTQRDVLLLLSIDPPASYRDISRILDIPMGSIGPTRARGLARLRATPVVRAYLETAMNHASGHARSA
jgi:RNA polymerase sigma factor (sigma-70 family)